MSIGTLPTDPSETQEMWRQVRRRRIRRIIIWVLAIILTVNVFIVPIGPVAYSGWWLWGSVLVCGDWAGKRLHRASLSYGFYRYLDARSGLPVVPHRGLLGNLDGEVDGYNDGLEVITFLFGRPEYAVDITEPSRESISERLNGDGAIHMNYHDGVWQTKSGRSDFLTPVAGTVVKVVLDAGPMLKNTTTGEYYFLWHSFSRRSPASLTIAASSDAKLIYIKVVYMTEKQQWEEIDVLHVDTMRVVIW